MGIVEKRFPVIEVFGPTIQGEGPEVGTRCAFVRFGGCDYRCAWCDSAPAVLPDEVRLAKRLTAEQIVDRLSAYKVPLILISGGNPLLHELGPVVDGLRGLGYRVSVETQGTLWKAWINRVDQVVVSPKPPSSGMTTSNVDALRVFLEQTRAPVTLKVPCLDERDVSWANGIAGAFPRYPFFLSVVTLMGGLSGTFAGGAIDTTQDILERYQQIIELSHMSNLYPHLRNARILPQVHALVWGHERGH